MPQKTFEQHYHLRKICYFIIFIALLWLSSVATAVNFTSFFANFGQFTDLLSKMSHPDWHFATQIVQPIEETIQMSLIGTTIGTLLAVPFALLAARNLMPSAWVRGVTRFILNLVRTLPDLLLAALFVAIVGIGPVAGVITLAVFSFGMVSKLFYEALEVIDPGPLEAMKAAGAGQIQMIVLAVIPQITGTFMSYFLYTLEINVRASTVLGYLGAGGIGVFLQRSLDQFNYSQTAVIIIVILVIVFVIDGLSNYLREKIA